MWQWKVAKTETVQELSFRPSSHVPPMLPSLSGFSNCTYPPANFTSRKAANKSLSTRFLFQLSSGPIASAGIGHTPHSFRRWHLAGAAGLLRDHTQAPVAAISLIFSPESPTISQTPHIPSRPRFSLWWGIFRALFIPPSSLKTSNFNPIPPNTLISVKHEGSASINADGSRGHLVQSSSKNYMRPLRAHLVSMPHGVIAFFLCELWLCVTNRPPHISKWWIYWATGVKPRSLLGAPHP